MMMISYMAWRIGDILDIGRQLDWIGENGFEAVSFHASPGVPGQWQGIPLGEITDSELEALRRRLEAFEGIEVHAPFEYGLRQPGQDTFEKLLKVCRASAAIGASVVTIHSGQPGRKDDPGRSIWRRQIEELSDCLEGTKTRVGLELTGEFDVLNETDAPNVGVTLDIGHLYQRDVNGKVQLMRSQKVGPIITGLGERLIHLHLHDYDGVVDHIEIGTGFIDYADIFLALKSILYCDMLCMELNPERVTPEGILRSARFIRKGME